MYGRRSGMGMGRSSYGGERRAYAAPRGGSGMFGTAFSEPMNWQAMLKTSELTPAVQGHLTKVYNTLALVVLSAAVGAYAHLQFNIGGLLTMLGMFGTMMWFHATPAHDATQVTKRFALLMGFGALKGASVGPLIDMALRTDPSIVMTAFVGTTCVFACFSAVAMFAKKRSMLFMGGLLSSCVSLMFFLSIANMFVRSQNVYLFQLYFGLIVFCGYVMFDTQMIVNKFTEHGDKDYQMHAFQLFVDFAAIFVRLLVILARNSNNKKRERR